MSNYPELQCKRRLPGTKIFKKIGNLTTTVPYPTVPKIGDR